MGSDYQSFIAAKSQSELLHGFKPTFMPDFLFPFQQHLVDWSVRKGRAAIFADCGLGKTPMQLAWAQNVVEQTNGNALILTPLAVGAQTVREAHKFGFNCAQSRDGSVADRITVTNYQQLHKFDWKQFKGVVCDESSILKNFDGSLRKQITEFMRQLPYRLLCTATAAPNDYIELGTSSEAIGDLRQVEMMSHFFNHEHSGEMGSKWRLKKHAAKHLFWQWICTWARAVRKPSDLGFSNDGYQLPPLKTIEHVVQSRAKNENFLFDLPAVGLDEQRAERKRTINERCELAAQLLNSTGKSGIAWCHLNPEGDLLAKLIDGAVQVSGSDSDEEKEKSFTAFVDGQIRVLVSKPSIAALGMNFQHCAHQTFFPSHSFEQWYQAVRRSWRFGQKNEVVIDVISSEGESGVLANMNRKAEQADEMFAMMVELLSRELKINRENKRVKKQEIPVWL